MTSADLPAEKSAGSTDVDAVTQPLGIAGIIIVAPGFPNVKIRNAIIMMNKVFGGILPVAKCDSESAKRAHYKPAESKVIVNTAAEHMHTALGKHRVVLAYKVPDRAEAASRCKALLLDMSFKDVEIHRQAEPEYFEDFIVFVTAPALDGIAFMFWPLDSFVTEEIHARLPAHSAWTEKDTGMLMYTT